MASFRIHSDGPRPDRDQLGFDRYVEPVISLLTDPQTETPFTIGIFGAWGTGKTTVLRMIEDGLGTRFPRRFLCVQFNPWTHRNEQNMLVPLLHTIHDTVAADPQQRFLDSAAKIANVLLRLGADVLLKALSGSVASLERLEELEAAYLKQRGRVESELRTLRKTLQTEANAIAKKGARILLLIDDLDRCTPEQIIDVLEAVKLFLDLEHVFVILAVDKEVIDRGIEVKYGKFSFGDARRSSVGAEYLEKMVQLPLYLLPLHPEQVDRFIQSLEPGEAVLEHLALLRAVLARNPRKIKRILNILAVAHAIARNSSFPAALDFSLVARLVVLQVQSATLYSQVRLEPDLLVALEGVYVQRLNVSDETHFSHFGARAKAVQEFCLLHYHPESYLARLFENEPFTPHASELTEYVSMLGG